MAVLKRLGLAFTWLTLAAMMALFLLPSFVPAIALADNYISGALRDAGNRLAVDCEVGCGAAGTPFTGGSVGVATGPNQSVGLQAYNPATSQMDAVTLDPSDNINDSAILRAGPNSGGNVIGTTLILASTRTTVSGNNPSGAFGTTVCATPPCTKQVVSGAGVLTTMVWNSLTAMSGFSLTCWDGTSAGTIDNQLFQVQVMSAGGTLPIPTGGWKFSTGLFCQTSAAITTSQAFNFWTHV